MSVASALLAFTLAAALLAMTPGLDTALVLRAAIAAGPRAAAATALGVGLGCLAWGACVALGLGALVAGSPLAFAALQGAGAGYLVWQGLRLLVRPRRALLDPGPSRGVSGRGATGFLRGLLTNLLNPKMGLFYGSLLPQFVPAGVDPGPFVFGLAAIHVLLSLAWFALLIAGARRLAAGLERPGAAALLDRLTGSLFVAFGLRLAASHPGPVP